MLTSFAADARTALVAALTRRVQTAGIRNSGKELAGDHDEPVLDDHADGARVFPGRFSTVQAPSQSVPCARIIRGFHRDHIDSLVNGPST